MHLHRNVSPPTAVHLLRQNPYGEGSTNHSISHESSMLVTRTYSPKAADQKHDWLVIDAADVVLGRLASHAAALLRGKHKTTFAPHMDMGDHVVIVNADKVVLTSNKAERKIAYRHSGYPGGLKQITYTEMLEKHPARAVEKAIRGMLPKNSLGRDQFRKLRVYAGPEHPHAAQQPTPYTISQVAQ